MAIPFNQRNFQKELEGKLKLIQADEKVPTLLLHSCCAPCSSYCIEYLSEYFKITVFYYNPNITGEAEYKHRVEEEKRFIKEFPTKYPVDFIEGDYEVDKFYQLAKGLEQCPEGGERCFKCYELRLDKTARLAAKKGFDYFTTTLSISPLKNSVKLNEIGLRVQDKYGSEYLLSDFKKREGYKRSIQLSQEYNLYRQNFCGCEFSKSAIQKSE